MDPEYIRARRAEDDIALDEIYDTYPELFTIHLYHGGYFTDPPDRVYVNEELDFCDLMNIDKFGMQELEVIKSRLGYTDQVPHFFHFCAPHGNLDTGLYRIRCDEDLIKLVEFVRGGDRFIDVYMEHGCSNVVRYSQSQCSEVLSLCWYGNGEGKGSENRKASEVNEDTGDNQTGYHVRLDNQTGDNQTGDNQTGEHNAKSADPGMEYSNMFQSLDDFEPFMDGFNGSKEKQKEKQHSQKETSNHNVEQNDKNVHNEPDGEYDSEEDSEFFVDENNDIQEDEVDMRDFKFNVDLDVEDERNDVDHDLDVLDNDNFDTDGEYDSEENLGNIREKKLKQVRRMYGNDNNFHLGMMFGTKAEVKKMIKRHTVETKRQLKLVKDEADRIRVRCFGDLGTNDVGKNVKEGAKSVMIEKKTKSVKKSIAKVDKAKTTNVKGGVTTKGKKAA